MARDERSRWPRAARVLPLAVALAACSPTRWLLPAPQAQTVAAATRIDASLAPPLRFGAPLRAEVANARSATVDESLGLRARIFVARTLPPLPLAAPLDNRARAITDGDTGVLRLAPVLAGGGCVLDPSSIDRIVESPELTLLADREGALPPGVTVRVSCDDEASGPPGEPSPLVAPRPRASERVALLVRRLIRPGDPEQLEVAFELACGRPPAAPPEPFGDVDATPGDAKLVRALVHGARALASERREVVALAPEVLPERARFGWVLPSPFARAEARWVVVVLELRPPPTLRDPGAVAHARAVVELDALLAAERARLAADPTERPPAWERRVVDRAPADVAAIRSEIHSWPRRGLVLLGEELKADLLLETSLAAPDVVLEDVAGEVGRALATREHRERGAAALGGPGGALAGGVRSLHWEVELATLEALLFGPNRASTRGVVERRFGVAFDESSGEGPAIVAAARRLSDERALERLILVRNLLALEDPRPGQRLVAARWLGRVHPGLEGYDPLAPFDERRASVDRLWDALAPEEEPAAWHRKAHLERP